MELDDGDVLFTSGLLGFDESGGVVDAHDEAASDFRIEGAGVTGFVDLQDFLDPSNDLVGRWVRWLVKVDNTVGLKNINGTVSGGVAAREGSEVRRLDIELVKVLQGNKH